MAWLSSKGVVSLEGSLITRLGVGDKMGYYTKVYDKTCVECGAKLYSEIAIILHTCDNKDKEN